VSATSDNRRYREGSQNPASRASVEVAELGYAPVFWLALFAQEFDEAMLESVESVVVTK